MTSIRFQSVLFFRLVCDRRNVKISYQSAILAADSANGMSSPLSFKTFSFVNSDLTMNCACLCIKEKDSERDRGHEKR